MGFSAASLSSDSSIDSAVEPKQQPWLLVGLGNPGKYQGTRHNVGFEMIDAVAEAEGISMTTVSFKSLFGKEWNLKSDSFANENRRDEKMHML